MRHKKENINASSLTTKTPQQNAQETDWDFFFWTQTMSLHKFYQERTMRTREKKVSVEKNEI